MVDLVWQSSFTRALAGGILIGTSASLLLGTLGRVAGWSSVVGALVSPERSDQGWRLMLLAGLLVGGALAWHFLPGEIPTVVLTAPLYMVLAGAGLLVGFGTRLGGGCTSGHGVCGISRGSVRSVVATITFIATGMAAVFVMRLVGLLS